MTKEEIKKQIKNLDFLPIPPPNNKLRWQGKPMIPRWRRKQIRKYNYMILKTKAFNLFEQYLEEVILEQMNKNIENFAEVKDLNIYEASY